MKQHKIKNNVKKNNVSFLTTIAVNKGLLFDNISRLPGYKNFKKKPLVFLGVCLFQT